MSEPVLTAIAALFCTSCLVRIAPVFLPLRMGPGRQHYLQRLLPAAVFLNFAVYIVYSEGQREPLAALLSLALVAGIAWLGRPGLLGTALIGTALYFVLVRGVG